MFGDKYLYSNYTIENLKLHSKKFTLFFTRETCKKITIAIVALEKNRIMVEIIDTIEIFLYPSNRICNLHYNFQKAID